MSSCLFDCEFRVLVHGFDEGTDVLWVHVGVKAVAEVSDVALPPKTLQHFLHNLWNPLLQARNVEKELVRGLLLRKKIVGVTYSSCPKKFSHPFKLSCHLFCHVTTKNSKLCHRCLFPSNMTWTNFFFENSLLKIKAFPQDDPATSLFYCLDGVFNFHHPYSIVLGQLSAITTRLAEH